MKIRVNQSIVELVEGDITEQNTDAIVNAANRTLLGGGGVDGAIHRAGGPRIMEECRKLGGCDTGDAKITIGGSLPAAYVIHTVGPVYRDGKHHESDMLVRAYRRSLETASENGIATIAFPSISTGAYGFPLDPAAHTALKTVADYLMEHTDISLVRFVLLGQRNFKAYARALEDIVKEYEKQQMPVSREDD